MTLTLLLIAITVAHETGHAVAAQLQGLPWEVGVVRVCGVPVAPCVRAPSSALVAVSGPISASIAAVLLWNIDPLVLLVLGAIAGPISLIPFPGSDGRQLLRALR